MRLLPYRPLAHARMMAPTMTSTLQVALILAQNFRGIGRTKWARQRSWGANNTAPKFVPFPILWLGAARCRRQEALLTLLRWQNGRHCDAGDWRTIVLDEIQDYRPLSEPHNLLRGQHG
jgi:hypothetical protein